MTVSARADCSNCGAAVPPDSWFCQRCGSPLEHETAEPPEEVRRPGTDDLRGLVRYWGPRAAAAALIAVAVLSVLLAILVLVFGAFVEPVP